jgi:hypothetical protein
MDIAKLRLQLKDEYTYDETTKEIFLKEIESVFEAQRNLGDTELIVYEGACIGKKCDNCGKRGYRFVGNHSRSYIDLLFEIEEDEIKDITACAKFKTVVRIADLGIKFDIDVDLDAQINGIPF